MDGVLIAVVVVCILLFVALFFGLPRLLPSQKAQLAPQSLLNPGRQQEEGLPSTAVRSTGEFEIPKLDASGSFPVPLPIDDKELSIIRHTELLEYGFKKEGSIYTSSAILVSQIGKKEEKSQPPTPMQEHPFLTYLLLLELQLRDADGPLLLRGIKARLQQFGTSLVDTRLSIVYRVLKQLREEGYIEKVEDTAALITLTGLEETAEKTTGRMKALEKSKEFIEKFKADFLAVVS